MNKSFTNFKLYHNNETISIEIKIYLDASQLGSDGNLLPAR